MKSNLYKLLLFYIAIIIGIISISWIFSYSKYKDILANREIYFYSLDSLIRNSNKHLKQNILSQKLVATSDTIYAVNKEQIAKIEEYKYRNRNITYKNRVEISPSNKVVVDSLLRILDHLTCFYDSTSSLEAFFQGLDNSNKELLRIWYYGDSQIEGDRITSHIRRSLQSQFGGSGMGYLPLSNPATYMNVALNDHDQWVKQNCFRHRKSKTPFYVSGLTFTPNNPEGSSQISIEIKKWQRFSSLKLVCGTDSLNSKRLLLFKHSKDSIWDTAKINFKTKTITEFQILNSFKHGQFEIKSIRGSSPIFGYYLDGANYGIQLDNFGIRGHSGDGLRLINNQLLHQESNRLNTGLIIFQFGNNMIPYLKTDVKSKQWVLRIFRGIINKYKYQCPSSSLLLIGPGDMGYEDSEGPKSYESCAVLNSWLKEFALNEHIAYFDFYSSIQKTGGILEWRKNGLASLDGHLSPRGQKAFAKLFKEELLSAYSVYKITTGNKVLK